ncbi:MAG: hypothetical protein AABN33_06495 [Acidobacteriota bacterium]
MRRHYLRSRSKIGMVIGLTLFVSLGLVRIETSITRVQAQEPTPCTEGTVVAKSGNGAIGTTDPLVLFSTDGGTTFTQQAFIVAPLVQPPDPTFYDTIPGTEYVAISADKSAPSTPFVPGTSIPQFFQTTFQVPAGCQGPTLTVAVHADNVATAFLNGIQIGTQPDVENVASFHNPAELFTSAGPFLVGVNTLTFRVGNYSNQLALDFEARICCSAECNDQEPPAIDCSVTQNSLWPPNHQLVNVGLTATVTDDCDSDVIIGGGPGVNGVAVYSDEQDLDIGSGNHSPDAKNVGLGTLRLRSERAGPINGRVYLIVVQATDESGKTGFCTQTVTVPHDQSKASKASVAAQAAAAAAFFNTNHVPPPGFVQVGVGPVVGPKQ